MPHSPTGAATEPVHTDNVHDSAVAAWTLRIVFYGSLTLLVVLMFQDLSREVVGGLGLALIMVLLLMKVPVGVAMIVGSALGIWALSDTVVLASAMRLLPHSAVAGWSFSVIPMFILMGLLLWRSGASERLYTASRRWIGWVPGGLAVGTNIAGSGLATVSGSTLGVTYALGRIGVPEMLRAGYDRRFATASILMAGTGGQLIPPSILLVVYAGIVSIPVGPQLLAGIVPGLLLALAYCLLLIGLALAFPALAGKDRLSGDVRSTWNERWRSLTTVWPIPALALSMLYGLYSGIFTATEAGAFGAAGALLITWAYCGARGLGRAVRLAVGDTVRTTGAIFLLIIGAMILGRFLTLSGLASWSVSTVSDLGLSRYQLLFALLLLYLVLGMFMDSLTMMLITVPILVPILTAYDISLMWFGVFVVLLGELSVITPPVGVLTFVLHKLVQSSEVSLGQRITLGDVFVGVLWFLPVSILVLTLLIVFPDIVEFLPTQSAGE